MSETKSKTYTAPVRDTGFGSEQRRWAFPNGYGASVVRGPHTYGGSKGLFELAVTTASGELVYDTPITNDVLGWLTEDEVQALLGRIEALPAVTR